MMFSLFFVVILIWSIFHIFRWVEANAKEPIEDWKVSKFLQRQVAKHGRS